LVKRRRRQTNVQVSGEQWRRFRGLFRTLLASPAMAEERVPEHVPEAWVALPDSEISHQLLAGHPYDFGFVPAMSRLVLAHLRIAAAFGQLYREIMFSPEGVLTRDEREMVAAVAAAAQDCFY
jgi:hypothetical protein